MTDEVGTILVAGVDHNSVSGREMGEHVVDVALDALGRDAVLFVVGELFFAPTAGLVEGALDRTGDGVGVEDHPPVDVARGAADGLDQRGF